MSAKTVSLGSSIIAVPAMAIGGWMKLGEPLHRDGMWAAAITGLVIALFVPGLLLCARQLPLLLVPPSWRRWYRHRHGTRPYIPKLLRLAVYYADGWRCRWCGSAQDLQLDHVKPWAAGGLSVIWNFITLCGRCNKIKSNCWVARDGYVFYKPWPGHNDRAMALRILAWEKRHRWSPIRLLFASLYLGG